MKDKNAESTTTVTNECYDAKQEADATANYLSNLLMENPKGAKYNTVVKAVRVRALNFNNEFRKDMCTGKGIIIDNPEAYNKRGEKNYHGLQSPFFGDDYNDDVEFSQRYKCECGNLIGKMYDDGETVCPRCGQPVSYSDTDLAKTGWVDLHGYPVLTPIYYVKLQNLLGGSDGKYFLDLIIKMKNKKLREKNSIDELEMIEKYNFPFIGKGLTWLSKNIDEVLEWYYKKKGGKKEDKKSELYKELKNNECDMFAYYLPVYSAALRTEMPGEKECKLYKMKINTNFQAIIRCANDINNILLRPRPKEFGDELSQTDQEDIDILLAKIQENVIRVFNEEFATLDGKKGIIQGKIIGGRHDFTSRNIIVPGGMVLGADEVCIPYITFLELYKMEIVETYRTIFGASIQESYNRVHMAADAFDEVIYKIMLMLLDKYGDDGTYDVIISRNPCINVGSHGGFKIAYIKPNINDKTLTINTRVLTTMNADFDGDQVNIYRPLGCQVKTIINALDPKYQYYIDGRTGYANNAMLPAKDEIAVANELFSLTDKCPLNNDGLPDKTYMPAVNKICDDSFEKFSKDLAKKSAEKILFDITKLVNFNTKQ